MRADYKGKTVLITGSTQGVGKALADAFFERGANVVLNGRSESKRDKVLESFGSSSDRVAYVAADITTDEGAERLINSAVDRFGGIDILINNAGMSSYGDLEDSNPKVIREVLDSNATGSLIVTHFALPHIRKAKGKILFISSLAGLHGLGGHAIYSAGKMALIAVAQGLRKEAKRHGYFVGYACLGFTENDQVKRTLAPDGTLEPVPSRPGIKPATKDYAVRMILKQLRRKRFRSVHTLPGKLLFGTTRVSERLLLFGMGKGYDAERKFLENLKKDNSKS